MLALLLFRGFYVNDTYRQVLMKIWLSEYPSGRSFINTLREKQFSPVPGIEPGYQVVRPGDITLSHTDGPLRKAVISSLIGFPLTLRKH